MDYIIKKTLFSYPQGMIKQAKPELKVSLNWNHTKKEKNWENT